MAKTDIVGAPGHHDASHQLDGGGGARRVDAGAAHGVERRAEPDQLALRRDRRHRPFAEGAGLGGGEVDQLDMGVAHVAADALERLLDRRQRPFDRLHEDARGGEQSARDARALVRGARGLHDGEDLPVDLLGRPVDRAMAAIEQAMQRHLRLAHAAATSEAAVAPNSAAAAAASIGRLIK